MSSDPRQTAETTVRGSARNRWATAEQAGEGVLEFDPEGRYMAVGWSVWKLPSSEAPHDILSAYLEFVYSLRRIEQGTPIPLRQDDLEVLESRMGWSCDRIRLYLIDLMLEMLLEQESAKGKSKRVLGWKPNLGL